MLEFLLYLPYCTALCDPSVAVPQLVHGVCISAIHRSLMQPQTTLVECDDIDSCWEVFSRVIVSIPSVMDRVNQSLSKANEHTFLPLWSDILDASNYSGWKKLLSILLQNAPISSVLIGDSLSELEWQSYMRLNYAVSNYCMVLMSVKEVSTHEDLVPHAVDKIRKELLGSVSSSSSLLWSCLRSLLSMPSLRSSAGPSTSSSSNVVDVRTGEWRSAIPTLQLLCDAVGTSPYEEEKNGTQLTTVADEYAVSNILEKLSVDFVNTSYEKKLELLSDTNLLCLEISQECNVGTEISTNMPDSDSPMSTSTNSPVNKSARLMGDLSIEWTYRNHWCGLAGLFRAVINSNVIISSLRGSTKSGQSSGELEAVPVAVYGSLLSLLHSTAKNGLGLRGNGLSASEMQCLFYVSGSSGLADKGRWRANLVQKSKKGYDHLVNCLAFSAHPVDGKSL